MSLKAEMKKLLLGQERERLVALVQEERRSVATLNRLIFNQDELVRWRAVTALGWVAREDPYLLENLIGRLIYTMNDDSGSIGWMAPQALGEICANDPDLVEDFFSIVVSSMEIPAFTSGVIWALGRVAPVRPDLTADTGPDVARHLTDSDPEVRGLACWTLGRLQWAKAKDLLVRHVSDPGQLSFYENGQIRQETVGGLAQAALALLEAGVSPGSV